MKHIPKPTDTSTSERVRAIVQEMTALDVILSALEAVRDRCACPFAVEIAAALTTLPERPLVTIVERDLRMRFAAFGSLQRRARA